MGHMEEAGSHRSDTAVPSVNQAGGPAPAVGRISVLLMDPKPFSRACLSAALCDSAQLALTAIGSLDELSADQPDVVLLRWHGSGGAQKLRLVLGELRERWPGAGRLVISDANDADLVAQCFLARASACLPVDIDPDTLRRVILLSRLGFLTYSLDLMPEMEPYLAETPPSSDPSLHLTPRQRQVHALVAQGRSNRAIAAALGISESTVKAYVRALLTRLRVANRTQIAVGLLARRGEDD